MTENNARKIDNKYREIDDVDRDEALDDLQALQEAWDQEVAHIAADRILTTLLDDDEIVSAYEAIGKWYA